MEKQQLPHAPSFQPATQLNPLPGFVQVLINFAPSVTTVVVFPVEMVAQAVEQAETMREMERAAKVPPRLVDELRKVKR